MKAVLGSSTRTCLEAANARDKVRRPLASEGLGFLTEVDVAARFHEKRGVARDPHRILETCNPGLDNPDLARVARDARGRLERVMNAMSKEHANA